MTKVEKYSKKIQKAESKVQELIAKKSKKKVSLEIEDLQKLIQKYQKKLNKLNQAEPDTLKRKAQEPQAEPVVKKQKTDPENNTTLLLFYAYVEPEWNSQEYDLALHWAQETAALHGVTGRLRVAREGFNGTMTGTGPDGIRAFCQAMRDWKPELFGNVDFKFTDGLPIGQLFPALKVFPVTELVNYGLAGKQPQLKNGGVHLEAAEYHKKMEEPNTVIIDVRNSYEAEIGRFQPPQGGAEYIDPKMRVSTEFPGWVDKNKEKLKGKQIMMYCTGGIRCERASALLREKGLDNIYQMQGGIHRYLESYAEDGGYWIGKNYTFDKRFAHGAANSEVVGKCVSCKESFEKYRGKKRCPACGVPLLICEACQAKKLELKSVCALCEEQGKRPEQKQRKKRDGNGQSCAMCLEEFKTRNALFRHLKETGHMNRPRKNK